MSDLAQGLAARGHRLTVLTATAGDSVEAENPRVLRLGQVPRESVSLVAKALRGLRFFCRCCGWLLIHGRAKDQIWIASNPPFIGVLGLIVRLRGLHYSFIFQDLFPLSAVHSGLLSPHGPLTWISRRLLGLVCAASSNTIVLSESMRQGFEQEFGPSARLKVIHNWAVEQASPIARSANSFAQQQGLVDAFVVQYSGNFGRLHELDTLLEAARLLQQHPIHFLFIGGGAQAERLQRWRQQHQLHHMQLLPYQPRQLLPESLAVCDLAAIALRPGVERIVAPCKLYGILASGKAVLLIASRHCELAQMLQQAGCALVVQPGEAQQLAAALRELQADPQRVAAMGERSRSLYAARFGRERSIDAYAALLA
jgi:glycosyltransferase involved in cell wall biosynthesis